MKKPQIKNQHLLNRQDKWLHCERKLDGTVIVSRTSPFNSQKDFPVLAITNQFTGSFLWILKDIMLKDSQRFDFINNIVRENNKIKNKEDDDRVHRETAELIQSNEKIVI
jgi:hypothetical protein|tara:strand:+ start:294 stop:623 length:330 start_codon:yes stop_codon:yes gene_type:complete